MNNKAKFICTYFDEILPDAKCELIYHKDYELLFAVILSAQTTDKSVNKVSVKLFKEYPTLESIANAKLEDIEHIIHSIGLSKTKAKNIISCAKIIHENYNDKVSDDFNVLITLPGVGRKTANVTLLELFSKPVMAVDTHVERVCKRLKIALKNYTPYDVEMKINKLFPKYKLKSLHHQFIHFGRYICLSRNPKCENCKLHKYCSFFHQVDKINKEECNE